MNFLIDPIPDEYEQAIKIRNETLATRRASEPREAVLDLTRLWRPGQDIRVAFLGGNAVLYAKIEQAASEWTKYGDIHFDFKAIGTNQYRSWSRSDSSYQADIRIAFDAPGYWSLVGTDCIDRKVTGPAKATMNFRGFDDFLPPDYTATVIHEFGHALGFQHEHQHPEGFCESEFRWDNDPGYEETRDARGTFIADANGKQPGIYTYLGGPPNKWGREKVDFNLRQLRPSSAYLLRPFDALSIMKYYFGPEMFKNGKDSKCFSPQNLVLSAGDKAGIAEVYPL
jgi:hypothetical protein